MRIETTMRFHYKLVRRYKVKKTDHPHAVRTGVRQEVGVGVWEGKTTKTAGLWGPMAYSCHGHTRAEKNAAVTKWDAYSGDY